MERLLSHEALQLVLSMAKALAELKAGKDRDKRKTALIQVEEMLENLDQLGAIDIGEAERKAEYAEECRKVAIFVCDSIDFADEASLEQQIQTELKEHLETHWWMGKIQRQLHVLQYSNVPCTLFFDGFPLRPQADDPFPFRKFADAAFKDDIERQVEELLGLECLNDENEIRAALAKYQKE